MPSSHDPRLDHGITPLLIKMMRRALDRIPEELPFFESRDAPVDMYGVGSRFLRGESNDFTADVARVRVGRRFRIAARIGRRPRANPDLRPVRLRRAARWRSR